MTKTGFSSKKVAAILLILFFAIISCKTEKSKITNLQRGFYYWKSTSSALSRKEKQAIDNLNIDDIYLKFFEVVPDKNIKNKPIAKLRLKLNNSDFNFEKTQITPTIFIKNEVLKTISANEIDSLANNINYLTNKYFAEKLKLKDKKFTEIQIDCDWTPSTKDEYFSLLRKIKTLSQKRITVTLRLYPYKFPDKMGVPPADRATLMCYNLLNPLAFENKNSIQDNRELKKYLLGAEEYPLPIDVALPIFSWIQVYRNNQFVKLLKSPKVNLKKFSKPLNALWREVTKEVELNTIFLRPGDKLKFEETDPKETHKSIELLKKYINFKPDTKLLLYHLDSEILNNYNYETLNNFFTDFAH